MRLRMLLAFAGAQHDQVVEIISSDLDYQGVGLRFGPGPDKDDAELESTSESLTNQFIRIESHTLKHHTIETLLRHYLACSFNPACPWLEISKATSFREFKALVKSTLIDVDTEELRDQVAWLALGFSLEKHNDDKTIRVAANLASFFKYFAQDWLENARGYNSTKHGLSAIPGVADFTLKEPELGEFRLGFGDSLTYLEFDKSKSGELEWHQSTEWVPGRKTTLTTFYAALMLRSVWEIARARHTGVDPGPRFSPDPDQLTIEILASPDGPPAISMRMHLFNEERN